MCDDTNKSNEADVERFDDESIFERRGFIASIGALILGLWAKVPFARAAAASEKVALPLYKLQSLEKTGGSKLVKVKNRKVLLVRVADDKIRAFNPTCTHKKCDVKFNQGTNKLDCKCHKSSYDLKGKVLGGPAPRDLEVYPSRLKTDRVLIKLPLVN